MIKKNEIVKLENKRLSNKYNKIFKDAQNGIFNINDEDFIKIVKESFIDLYGNTVLMYIVCSGKIDLIKKIFKIKNINILELFNSVNNNGDNIFTIACKMFHLDIVKFFIDKCKKIPFDFVIFENKDKMTPFDYLINIINNCKGIIKEYEDKLDYLNYCIKCRGHQYNVEKSYPYYTKYIKNNIDKGVKYDN